MICHDWNVVNISKMTSHDSNVMPKKGFGTNQPLRNETKIHKDFDNEMKQPILNRDKTADFDIRQSSTLTQLRGEITVKCNISIII